MVVTICIELKLKLDSLDWNRFVIVDGCGGGGGGGGWMCDDKNKRTKEGREGSKRNTTTEERGRGNATPKKKEKSTSPYIITKKERKKKKKPLEQFLFRDRRKGFCKKKNRINHSLLTVYRLFCEITQKKKQATKTQNINNRQPRGGGKQNSGKFR